MSKLTFVLLVGLPILALVILAQARRSRRDRALRELINQGNSQLSVAPKHKHHGRQQMGHWEVMRERDEE